MTEQRLSYDVGDDALGRAKQQFVEQLRRRHGPAVTIEIVTREVITPEPVATRPQFTVVGEWMTLPQASIETGWSWSSLKRWGTAGRIRMQRHEGEWQVHRNDVDRMRGKVAP